MITSVQNNKVKQWNKLKKKKERENSQTFLLEGIHLVEEAWKSDWKVMEVIVEHNAEVPTWLEESSITYVSDHVFNSITSTKTPQGIAAVVKIKNTLEVNGDNLVLIDEVQDPGNLGTIIRTADAAGFDGIVLGEGTVDLFNEKVIRATQGSIFHLPIYRTELSNKINELKELGYEIWATTLENAEPYFQTDIPEKVALLLGNEGSGIDKELIQQSTRNIHIPIFGQAESLNVAVAAGILIYYIASGKRKA